MDIWKLLKEKKTKDLDIKKKQTEDLIKQKNEINDNTQNFKFAMKNMNDCETYEKKSKKRICDNCSNSDFLVIECFEVCNNCGLQNKIMDNKLSNVSVDMKDSTLEYLPGNDKISNNNANINIESRNYRIKKQQIWNRVLYKDRNYIDNTNIIEAACYKWKINKSIIDNAKILYKKYIDIKNNDNIIYRGNNKISILGSCLFYGAKLNGNPMSTKEIAIIFKLKSSNITKGCKILTNIFKFANEDYIDNVVEIKYTQPHEFINRFKQILNIDIKYIDQIYKYIESVKRLNIVSDHQPKSSAAAVVLLVNNINNLKIYKKKIAAIFSLSEVTMTKTYKKIAKLSDIITNDIILNDLLKLIEDVILNQNIDDIVKLKTIMANIQNGFYCYKKKKILT